VAVGQAHLPAAKAVGVKGGTWDISDLRCDGAWHQHFGINFWGERHPDIETTFGFSPGSARREVRIKAL